MTALETREAVLHLLEDKAMTITFAESCTGGLLAASLVEIPAASSVFAESYVTYANESKMRLLGVSPDTLASHGAVSVETAAEMAEGAAERAGADVAVSVSGIAGPSGGSEEKPVGTVAFGFKVGKRLETRLMHFGALGRRAVREAAVDYAFETLLSLLS